MLAMNIHMYMLQVRAENVEAMRRTETSGNKAYQPFLPAEQIWTFTDAYQLFEGPKDLWG